MGRVSDFLNSKIQDVPTQEIGIGGFSAFVRVRDITKFSSEIPSTPVEDGSLVHDHIILKPLIISIEGDVSDVHLKSSPLIREFQKASATIGDLSSVYAPARTQSQISIVEAMDATILDAVNGIDALLDKGGQIFDMFGNRDSTNKSIQNQFIDAMESAHLGRQLVSIEMPFRKRENMRITSFTASTDNVSDSIMFTLEAEQMKFAELVYSETAARKPASGLGGQTTNKVEKGAQEGVNTDRSILSHIFGG